MKYEVTKPASAPPPAPPNLLHKMKVGDWGRGFNSGQPALLFKGSYRAFTSFNPQGLPVTFCNEESSAEYYFVEEILPVGTNISITL